MSKGLSGLLLAVLVTALGISVANGEACLYPEQLWGGDDPHDLYYCDPVTSTAVAVPCPAGQGFINDDNTTGCVDWSEWSDDCISKVAVSAAMCAGSGASQPHAFGDPSYFYLCLATGADPVKVSCKSGSGFYAGNKYLGCFAWATWRNITGCQNVQ